MSFDVGKTIINLLKTSLAWIVIVAFNLENDSANFGIIFNRLTSRSIPETFPIILSSN